jgi:hypothetical protein
LSYASPQTIRLGESLNLAPIVGGAVVSWSVSPALPSGISLDQTTGIISGAPTTTAPTTTHTVVAQNAAGTTSFAFQLSVIMDRSTTNRPDEQAGYQVQLVYALPSDGTDRAFDTNGQLAKSFAAVNQWLRAQTNGKGFRLDTFAGGNADVVFFRSERTDAKVQSYGAFIRDQLEYEMLAAGFDDPQKLYLVYYDGGSMHSCGGAAYPPMLPGQVGAMYLLGTPPNAAPCAANPLAPSVTQPGYFEFGGIHEVMHTIGFVATCAPNHTQQGHTSDSPNDLMYAGNQAWSPSILDVGRDDYFETGVAGCPDFASSAFLDPLPSGATPPPGWPYLNLSSQDCSAEGAARSMANGVVATIRFVNGRDSPIDVHFLDAAGIRQIRATVAPNEAFWAASRSGDSWLMASGAQCLSIVTAGVSHGRAVAR